MTDDIVERLRFCPHYEWSPLMREAAAEIERLTALHVAAAARAELAQIDNDRLTAALEMIAGKRQCINNLMSDKDIARRALEPKP